jgi:hypothetical protein
MKHYLLAVAFGAVVYFIGIASFGDGVYPIGSVIFSAGVAGIVLGVKALIRLALPRQSQLVVVLGTSLVLLLLVFWATFGLSSEHLTGGRVWFFVFWCVYLGVIEIGLFWPALVPGSNSTKL